MLYLLLALVLLAVLLLPVWLQDFLVIPALRISMQGDGPPDGAKQIFITTSDGKKLECWVVGQGPPLVVFHGNSDNLETFWKRQQRFAELGFTTYVFDYRGVGRSTGWPSQKGIFLDGEAVVTEVSRLHGVEVADLILVGISLGTGPVSYLTEKWQVKRAVLFSPYRSIKAIVQTMQLMRWYAPLLKYEFPNWTFLEKRFAPGNAPASIMVLHSRVDELIPFEHGAKVCDSVDACHECVLVDHESSNHHDTVENLWEEMAAWLKSGKG